MMKKLFLLLIVVISWANAVAQVKVRPGLKLGLNSAKLTNVYQSERKLGINGGLFVNVHLTRFYELQVEAGYSNQGTGYKSSRSGGFDPIIDGNFSEDINLEYLYFGIANKFFPIQNNGLNLIVGPSIDILVSENPNDFYVPFDFGLFAGVGYEFAFGLGLELRYKQGFLDVRDSYWSDFDDDEYDFFDGDNVLNGVLQLSATYRFGF